MRSLLYFCTAFILSLLLAASSARAESNKGVQISFLPPPLENASYSLGIYEAKSGKLVRRLYEAVTEDAFTAGLNGFITRWDGKDDDGKPVPAGRYAARGYGVGPLKVEGVEFLGNDWIDQDESLRIKRVAAIAFIPEDDGLAVVATLANGSNLLLRLSGKDGSLLWKQSLQPRTEGRLSKAAPAKKTDERLAGVMDKLPPAVELRADEHYVAVIQSPELAEVYSVRDGAKFDQTPPQDVAQSKENFFVLVSLHSQESFGKDKTFWLIDENILYQLPVNSHVNEPLMSVPREERASLAVRALARKEDEPAFKAVSASASHDRLYLLEEMPGWQRVRGLSWLESKEEDGKKVSNWETFFERNIRQSDPARGLSDPDTAKTAIVPPVKLNLVENPLSPSKAATLELSASLDENGSYLVAADGLRLRKISKQADLRAVRLVKGSSAGSLTLYQNDGAAWEEFSINGANEMMSFDAGEIEMTANGEKPADTKAAEPPDL